jgi:hypothetical protein
MKQYNGYRSWNAWNVSLWINNDEGLYNMARRYARFYNRHVAADLMKQELFSMGSYRTPDGAPYTITSIKLAMRGL